MTNKKQHRGEAKDLTLRARVEKALKEKVVVAALRAGESEQEWLVGAVKLRLEQEVKS
jgi:hypothetical protein